MDCLSTIASSMHSQGEGGRKFLTFIVYVATLVSAIYFFRNLQKKKNQIKFNRFSYFLQQLDNILLTVIGKCNALVFNLGKFKFKFKFFVLF